MMAATGDDERGRLIADEILQRPEYARWRSFEAQDWITDVGGSLGAFLGWIVRFPTREPVLSWTLEVALLLVAAALIAPAAVVLPWTTPFVLVAYATLALLVAADWRRLRRTLPLSAERIIPARVFVGRTATVAIDLRNRDADSAQVDVVEEVPRLLRGDDTVFRGVVLAPGEARTVTYDISPVARGDHPIGTLHLLRRSRFGLLERRETLPEAVVSAYPDVSRRHAAGTPRARRQKLLVGR